MAKRKAARAKGRTGARRASSGKSRPKAAARSSRAKARKATARASSRKSAKRRAPARKAGRKAVAARRPAKRVVVKTSRTATARTKATKKTSAAKKAAPRKAARAITAAARKPAAGKLPAAIRNRAAAAKVVRTAPALNRARRIAQDDDLVPSPPSSLDLDRTASAARTGRRELHDRFAEHTETSPALTGGDVDADWESAYSVGDEAPGGDNPTPDQDIVDDIGRAIGVQYEDNEELKGEKKISDRDRKRWELDPASAEDYPDHDED